MADDEREAHASDAPFQPSLLRKELGAPLPDAIYDSKEQLFAAYQAHAYNNGYGIAQNVSVWTHLSSHRV